MATTPPYQPSPRRGQIWSANLGNEAGPRIHTVVVVSLDARNTNTNLESILVVPFGSGGGDGPTAFSMQPSETGLPGTSWLKGHFITTIRKAQLRDLQPRMLSSGKMRQLCAAVRRAYDPDAPPDAPATR
jgi:mRNA-degrading endonuclease toxin of MazEF toxin-antitoxin module